MVAGGGELVFFFLFVILCVLGFSIPVFLVLVFRRSRVLVFWRSSVWAFWHSSILGFSASLWNRDMLPQKPRNSQLIAVRIYHRMELLIINNWKQGGSSRNMQCQLIVSLHLFVNNYNRMSDDKFSVSSCSWFVMKTSRLFKM